jgi:hypothetical protein
MADMPELTHWRDRSKDWTPEQSDVIPWIVGLNLGADMAEAQKIMAEGKTKGVIEFLPERKIWRGTEDTRRLDEICGHVEKQKKKKPRKKRERAAKPAQRSTAPALPLGPRVRCNDRMAAALAVFHRWKAASKVPAWTFHDLARSFVIHSGGGKPDTMRRYIRALTAAGWLVKDANGMLSASPASPASP